MGVLKWLTVVLCVAQGGFMVLDGTRALVVGDYITPSSGRYAGQLGPWAQLVSAIGISPHATGIKLLFVILGVAWMGTSLGIAIESSWAWLTGVIIAAATLWYLVPGTIVSAAVLIILLATPLRTTLTRP